MKEKLSASKLRMENRLDRFPSSQKHMFLPRFNLGSQTLLYTVGSQYFRTSSLLSSLRMERLDRFPSSQKHMFVVRFILGSQILLYTVGSQYFRTSSLLCRFSHCVSWISQWLFSGGGGRKSPSGCFQNLIIFSHEITGCFCHSLSSAVSLCRVQGALFMVTVGCKVFETYFEDFFKVLGQNST